MDTPSDIARRFIDALHALDRDGMAQIEPMVALFATSATLVNPALRRAGERREGHDGARAFWHDYAAACVGARTEFFEVLVDARHVALFWRTARDGPTPLRYHGATLLALDGEGRVAELRGYYDPAELMR